DSFKIHGSQLGYVAYIAGRPVACEVFSSNQIFRHYWPRILDGLALDATLRPNVYREPHALETVDGRVLRKHLARSVVDAYRGIGIGIDTRFSSRRVTGSALINESTVEHFVAHFGQMPR